MIRETYIVEEVRRGRRVGLGNEDLPSDKSDTDILTVSRSERGTVVYSVFGTFLVLSLEEMGFNNKDFLKVCFSFCRYTVYTQVEKITKRW